MRTVVIEVRKPDYIVFSDHTLIDMAEKKTAIYEFRFVNGVGEHKASQFDKTFLQAIAEFN